MENGELKTYENSMFDACFQNLSFEFRDCMNEQGFRIFKLMAPIGLMSKMVSEYGPPISPIANRRNISSEKREQIASVRRPEVQRPSRPLPNDLEDRCTIENCRAYGGE